MGSPRLPIRALDRCCHSGARVPANRAGAEVQATGSSSGLGLELEVGLGLDVFFTKFDHTQVGIWLGIGVGVALCSGLALALGLGGSGFCEQCWDLGVDVTSGVAARSRPRKVNGRVSYS